MKPVKTSGFTIVETMLFLGVSALLIMGILIGTGSSINIQRYRDSVSSLQSFLQKQYSDVSNVSNDSIRNTCEGAPNIPRGQSQCVILGKYITIASDDNGTISSKNVLGVIVDGMSSSASDVDAINAYSPYVTDVGAQTYSIEWDASAVKPDDGGPMALSMLIIRSPTSGVIRTFVSPDNSTVIPPNRIQEDILSIDSTLSQSQKICVDSNGLFTGSRMAVQINASATSASGIELLGDDSGC